MAGRFAYSKPNRRGPNDPWFRIGTLDIGSAALLGLMCAVSVLVYAIDKTVLDPARADSRRGQVGSGVARRDVAAGQRPRPSSCCG